MIIKSLFDVFGNLFDQAQTGFPAGPANVRCKQQSFRMLQAEIRMTSRQGFLREHVDTGAGNQS